MGSRQVGWTLHVSPRTQRDCEVANEIRHQIYVGGSCFEDIINAYRDELLNAANNRIAVLELLIMQKDGAALRMIGIAVDALKAEDVTDYRAQLRYGADLLHKTLST